jgi:hypothetical protein
MSLKNKNLEDPPEYMNETIKQAVATPRRAFITISLLLILQPSVFLMKMSKNK